MVIPRPWRGSQLNRLFIVFYLYKVGISNQQECLPMFMFVSQLDRGACFCSTHFFLLIPGNICSFLPNILMRFYYAPFRMSLFTLIVILYPQSCRQAVCSILLYDYISNWCQFVSMIHVLSYLNLHYFLQFCKSCIVLAFLRLGKIINPLHIRRLPAIVCLANFVQHEFY